MICGSYGVAVTGQKRIEFLPSRVALVNCLTEPIVQVLQGGIVPVLMKRAVT